MVQHSGDVQRDRAAAVGAFEPADDRATFASGDALRTGEHAQARLELPAAGAVVVQAGTTIRMWRGARGDHPKLKLNVQTGAAEVVAVHPLELQTELGVAVLQAGSELRVRSGPGGHVYDVTLGKALLISNDGRQRKLAAGESIGAAQPAPSAQAPAGDAAVAEALPEASREPADLDLRLGTTATIFDPQPPTRVQFTIPESCKSAGTFTLQGQAPVPLVPVTIWSLEPGHYEYHATCGSEAKSEGFAPNTWRGTLHVARNAGTAQLPRSAPSNIIEADGRTYTVLFQNLPPVLDVRWPSAPEASSYTLEVQLEAAPTLTLAAAQAQHVFAAGALPEGRHQLQFSAAGKRKQVKSRLTTLDLRFDNAAPMASLRAPPVSGFAPEARVHVAGLALPGAQVSALGQRLTLDAQQRFSGDVALPAGTRAIAVRIAHPRTGTRYYVRRVRPSP